MQNLTHPVAFKEIEYIIKIIQPKKILGYYGFTNALFQTIKEEIIAILYKENRKHTFHYDFWGHSNKTWEEIMRKLK